MAGLGERDRHTHTVAGESNDAFVSARSSQTRLFLRRLSTPEVFVLPSLCLLFFFFLSSPQLIFILSQRRPVTIEPLCAPTQHSCVPWLPLLHMTNGAAFEPPRPSLPASV